MNIGQLVIIGIGLIAGGITLYLLITTNKHKPQNEK